MKKKVICFGLGPIGISIARLVMNRPTQIEIVGAVDEDPKLLGKDIGVLMGSEKVGIKVEKSGSPYYKEADVVLHATSSYLSQAKEQFLEFCSGGVDVISTCEELAYPWFDNKEIAEELDFAARTNSVTLLGTGVNPGYVMDALAITLSSVVESVTEVRATRILDAMKRRLPFQKKVGLGLTKEEFIEKVNAGKFGHVGLPESMALVCSALGVELSRIDEKIYPRIAESAVQTEHFGTIPKGRVIGVLQDGAAFSNERMVATYHIEMYAGAEDPHDEITIIGNPSISLRIPGGTPGDIATASIIVNSIPRVIAAEAGLASVKDTPPAASIFN